MGDRVQRRVAASDASSRSCGTVYAQAFVRKREARVGWPPVEDRGRVLYRPTMNIVQSSLSLMGAFFVAVVTLGIATVAASWLMLGGIGPAYPPTPAYLAVNAVNSVFAALIGGYVVATVASSSPMGHAHALGLIMAAVGVAALAYNGFEPAQGQPSWYALLIIAQAPVTSTLGGFRVMQRIRKPLKRFSRRAMAADAARTGSVAEEERNEDVDQR